MLDLPPSPGLTQASLNPMKNKVIVAFSTCADRASGRALAEQMVAERLAACVNLLPGAVSVYRWDGRMQADDECLMVIKTTESRFPVLRDWLRQRHPYELPELFAVPVSDGLPAYLEWVAGEVIETPADTP